MRSRRSVLITLIFGTIVGCFVLSLSLGRLFPNEVIYTGFIWAVYYPISLLRQCSSRLLFICLYLVIWFYVFIKSVYVQRDAFAKTLAETLICMVIVAVPFVPFGIHYFSLLRYSSAIPSVYLRLLPFIGLFVVLLCSNFFYFEQRFSTAMIWAINVSMVTIFLITMADLLPLLSSQPFFSTLNYRLSIVNSIVTRFPLVGLFLFIIFGILCCSTIDAYFLARASRRSFFRRIIIPFSVTVMVILFLTILQIDYYRYRQFDYSAGINTIYLTTHRDKQVLWFDAKKIKVVSGVFRTLYPFGDFSARDTIRVHAKQLSKMAIIEGLNYYKLTRILNILAHGERDTVVYRALRSLVERKKYRYPSEYAALLRYIRERFASDTAEINVTGTITVNGKPLRNVDFFVNRWIASTLEYPDRIWMDKTDAHGTFHFTCSRGDGRLVRYFHVYFMLPDTIIGDNIEYLKIANLPDNLSTSGTYVLDTIAVTFQETDSPQGIKLLALYPETPLDSFALHVPQVPDTVAIAFHGRVLRSARYSIDEINVVTPSGMSDDVLAGKARARARTWRFYSQAESTPLDIFINTDRQ